MVPGLGGRSDFDHRRCVRVAAVTMTSYRAFFATFCNTRPLQVMHNFRLSSLRLLVSVTSLVCLVAACSSGGTVVTGDPHGAVAPTTGVALSAASYTPSRRINGQASTKGSTFASVAITLTNGPLGTPADLSALLFSISTVDGLSFAPTALAIPLSDCPLGAKLEAGSSLACTVVFELADEKTARSITYRHPDGREASSPIPDALCTLCGDACIDLQSDPANCGACGGAVPTGGGCVSGAPVCTNGKTQCANQCVDLTSDPNHCGTCSTKLDSSQICVKGKPSCDNGGTTCSGQCVSLANDSSNCGQCGHACASGCTQRQCSTSNSHNVSQIGATVRSCADYCGAQACLAGNVHYFIPFPPGACTGKPTAGYDLDIGCGTVAHSYGDCVPATINCTCAE